MYHGDVTWLICLWSLRVVGQIYHLNPSFSVYNLYIVYTFLRYFLQYNYINTPVLRFENAYYQVKCILSSISSSNFHFKAYDASELMKTYKGPKPEILIDQVESRITYISRMSKDTT